MLIDTHCHLTDKRFTDVKEVLAQAARNGVEKVIMPSTGLLDAKAALKIAQEQSQFCLLGIHPEDVSKIENIEQEVEELAKIYPAKGIVGIGEIGLDYYWDKEKKTEKEQVELFGRQMDLALRFGLPTAIHMRGAELEMSAELKQRDRLPAGQFHCFAGSPEFLEMILGMGYYVSFCGNITYKSAGNLRDLLKMVPVDRLLLETDSPYLPPEPLRGTVNSPANVKIIGEFVASELNIDIRELAKTTTENAKCLYSLEI